VLAMRASQRVGVPYSDDMIATARADFRAQADPDFGDVDGLLERYPGAQARNFDRQPGVSELDAVIAYLQMLGTLVDFSTFTPDVSRCADGDLPHTAWICRRLGDAGPSPGLHRRRQLGLPPRRAPEARGCCADDLPQRGQAQGRLPIPGRRQAQGR